ncbi:MAG TPA: glycosyltransferase [Thermoleophilaceae bacterium]|jgi:glycosyltransferase involved in cell wall biosynthesis
MRVAILLTVESFEHFFEDQLGVDAAAYVEGYRNDWAWDYCAALAARGAEPLVYVPSLRESGLRPTPDGYAVRFVPLGRGYRPWVRFPVLKRSPLGRYAAQAASAATMLAPLRAGLAEDRVDVLLVQEYWTARFDLFAARLETPIVAVDQGLPDRRELKALKRRTLPRAARVVVQTGAEAEKVRRYGGDPVQIPNGVDTDRFAPDPAVEREPGLVVCAARLADAHKRQSDLIRAIARLDEPWRLELLGIGPDEQLLRSLAAELGVAGRVEFAGFVSDKDELRERFRRCSVFALPSAFEGLPVALLEAMSAGAPAVGSDIPPIAEVVEDGVNGRLVPVASPAALADAIAAVGAAHEPYSARAREAIVRRFGSARMGAELERVIAAATETATSA